MRKSELKGSREDLIVATSGTTALARKDSGKICHNTGAVVTTTFTLPTDAVAGDVFEFLAVPAYSITVDPGTGNHFQIGATVGGAGKTVTVNTTAGAYIKFVCTSAPNNVIVWTAACAPVGTWTIAS